MEKAEGGDGKRRGSVSMNREREEWRMRRFFFVFSYFGRIDGLRYPFGI